MLTIVLFVLVFVVSAIFYYVEAIKSGLNAKIWLLAGFFLGPLVLPMFMIRRHVEWRKSVGFNNVYLTL